MTRATSLFRAAIRKPVRATKRPRLSITWLEDRTVPTSNLYLDFGDSLPAGGFNLTVDQLKGSLGSGGIQGPDFTTGQDNNLAGGDNLQFVSLSTIVNVDYNADG